MQKQQKMSENLQNPKSNDHKPLKSTTRMGNKKSLTEETDPDQDASIKCTHPTHPTHLNSTDIMNLMPVEYWENYIREKRIEATDGEALSTEQANNAINEVFVKRLQELESKAPNILEAKVETYKDWINVQKRVNEVLLDDFDRFEKAFQHHLESHETNSNHNFRRDISTLVKLIKRAFHKKNWSLAGLKFESVTPAFVMGLDEQIPQEREILEKLQKGEYQPTTDEKDVRPKRSASDENVMALAVEVAEKHDEINRLKQQLCALEDEILNAQKKIQLKDDVIKELRLDLKKQETLINSTKAARPITEGSSASKDLMMSQKTTNNQPKAAKSKGTSENLELVKNQLEEILNSTNGPLDCSSSDAECLKQVFMKLEKGKNEAQDRLKKIKESLLEVVMPDQSEERTFILSNSDDFLIRAVHAHIESIHLSRKELSGQVQKLLLEKGATTGELEALNNINRLNCKALEQLTDLLSSLTNEPVRYEDLYDSNSNNNNNPFCEAISRFHSELTKQIQDLTEEVAAQKERYRKREQEILELEKSHEEAVLLQSRVETMRTSLREKDKLIKQQNEAISRLTAPKTCSEVVDSFNNLNTQLQGACGRIENLANHLDSSRNTEQVHASESRKLNEELIETKHQNGQLHTQVERLRALLHDSSENYETTKNKYESLHKSFEKQSKQIHILEQRIAELQTNLTQDSMETKLLQTQLASLKEKEAQVNGELQALQERYRRVEIELKDSNETVIKLKNKLRQNEEQYLKSIKRQQETNVELVKNLNKAKNQMEKLQKEHEELMSYSEQQNETIKSYGKWKNEQRSSDSLTRESIEKYESYIRLLTEQNNHCLQRCASLHENNQILTAEIQRLRASTLSTKHGVLAPMTFTSDNQLIDRIDRLKQTTQRVLQQKLQFQNETPASLPNSSAMFHLPPSLVLPQFLQREAASTTPNHSKLSEDVASPSSTEMSKSDSSINHISRPS